MDTIGDKRLMSFLLIHSNDNDAFVAVSNNGDHIISKAADFIEENQISKKPDKLINCVEDISKKHNLKDVDAIAVTIGPGSFTGIRVGLSIAKGLALALTKKITPLNSFDIIYNRIRNEKPENLYCVLIEAKLPEYYYCIFKNSVQIKSGCIHIDKLSEIVKKDAIIVADFDDESIIKHSYFKFINIKDQKNILNSIIELTEKQFSNGEIFLPENVEPLYLIDFAPKTFKSNS